MAVRFTATFDDAELKAQFAEMQRRGIETTPVLKQIGTWMAYRAPEENWRTQGKRYQTGGWPELSPYTLAMRRWHATGPRERGASGQPYTEKILEVTGQLRGDGWSFRVSGKGDGAQVEAGTNNPHADKHQFGKWIKAPKRWERPMAKVPQRILIGIAPDDMRQAGEFADGHIERAVPGARRTGG